MVVPSGRGMLSEKLLTFQQLPGSCLRLCFLSLSGSAHIQCCSVSPRALTDCWLLMGGVCVAAVCQGISWFPSFSLACGWALGETWDIRHTVPNCIVPAGASPATPQDELMSWLTVSSLHGNLSEEGLVSHHGCVRF